MPGYVVLGKYTQQGLAGIKTAPERVKQTKSLIEKMRVRLVGMWWTLGQYDLVMVMDAPDDQTMAALALAMGMGGGGITQTMRALSEEEWPQVVNKIP
jgi:uncharacterized protein with GYD domain